MLFIAVWYTLPVKHGIGEIDSFDVDVSFCNCRNFHRHESCINFDLTHIGPK